MAWTGSIFNAHIGLHTGEAFDFKYRIEGALPTSRLLAKEPYVPTSRNVTASARLQARRGAQMHPRRRRETRPATLTITFRP
jgi:hypothetical protein